MLWPRIVLIQGCVLLLLLLLLVLLLLLLVSSSVQLSLDEAADATGEPRHLRFEMIRMLNWVRMRGGATGAISIHVSSSSPVDDATGSTSQIIDTTMAKSVTGTVDV